MSDDDYWAQLVSVTDVDSSPVLIKNKKFIIGRNEDCDLSFNGNKLVSGKHCCIERVDDGKVFLCDTSTNGTLLNMNTKVSKGKRHEIKHGDEIYVVYKKNAQQQNIGYLYQEKKLLENEMTQDYSFDEIDTTLSDEAVNQLNESTTSGDSDKNASLKRKIPQEKEDTSDKRQKVQKQKDEKQHKKQEPKVEDQPEASTSKDTTDACEDDDMLMTLTCIICQEILHDCISLQPCMHSFCSGCYSDWMDKSDQCPSCRMKVDRINKNHLVNNLVDAYLKAHPDQKRSDADLKELDEKNKITRDMLYPDRPPDGVESYSDSAGSGSGSDNDEDDNSEDGDNSDNPTGGTVLFGGLFGGFQQGGLFGGLQPRNPFTNLYGIPGTAHALTKCKQCPNYVNLPGFPDQHPPSDPKDEDAKTYPTAPNYVCKPNQNHVLCLCCMLPMPDRRTEYTDGGNVPPQRCTFCYRSFCHAYWGCISLTCNGCMGKLKDLNFGKKSLASIILDNAYESRVLEDFLESKNMSVKTLLAECLAKLVTGEYTCVNQQKLTFGINTPLCYACGLTIFKDLAYSYRKNIPKSDLPQEVTLRPDCYWGKNCRTQRNKPEHARRFNHVCEQTRTA